MKKVGSILLIVLALAGLGGVCAAYYHFEQQKEAVDKFVVNETYILTVGVTQI
ncbi:hypothetical protein LZP85_11385 [Priestia flexa]|jgi:hypothetical protein|uniref:Uncharacterized protein n=1 Tax=Priestia flexa TaxID=86664 RepID=A0A1N6QTM0_9BACI|nr:MULTISPECIES: hypothetical protein [Bacillaceae]MBN8251941.1 hypothetical protein [Priestia flexa]MBN8435443.1 hypothetical protein [Priestia flexa]MBY6085482.1 hypothetical protein [Priestia flexa]MCA0967981.1 hypothetical protein [Priestia flexa]MCA1203016.1 hypothetical protein [Priestia flexa]